MKTLILDLSFEKKSIFYNEFVRPITQILDSENKEYEVKHFLEEYSVEKYDKVILSGVALKDFKYLHSLESFSWISTFEKPLIGICAGAQIISLIFENTLKEHQEIGLLNVEKVKEDLILKGLSFPLEIYGLHNKSFESLKGFEVILESEIPELIKHKSKKIYACLFHPEVRNQKILQNFLKL